MQAKQTGEGRGEEVQKMEGHNVHLKVRKAVKNTKFETLNFFISQSYFQKLLARQLKRRGPVLMTSNCFEVPGSFCRCRRRSQNRRFGEKSRELDSQ